MTSLCSGGKVEQKCNGVSTSLLSVDLSYPDISCHCELARAVLLFDQDPARRRMLVERTAHGGRG